MTTTTAREYLRVSAQGSGDTSSTDEQHGENQLAAANEGWALHAKPYRDIDRSASRYATRDREGYDELVADLKANTFGADVLILWESSRGSRRVGEWVLLLELLEERGVRVHVTTHQRTYNPSVPRDRKSLLEDSVTSEYESGLTMLRTRRTAAKLAADGRPSGRAPYGYRREYEFVTINGKQKRVLHQLPDEDVAPQIRELFTRVQAGHSLRSIAKDWDARGIEKRSGGPFSSAHLRSLLLTRAYVGERVHNPGSKTGNDARTITPTTTVVKGTWDPLVDRATFLAVQHILESPERRTTRPGRGIHLLSMIARCDVCSGPLAVSYRKPEGEYNCQRASHVRVWKSELDDVAEHAMLRFLANPTEYAKLVDTEDSDAMLTAVRNDVASIEAELDELGDQVGSGALSPTLAGRAEPAILKRLADANAREQMLATPSRLRGLIEPGPGVEQRWADAEMSTKREVARLLLSPEGLGELRIERRPREAGPRRVPVAQRITWRGVE